MDQDSPHVLTAWRTLVKRTLQLARGVWIHLRAAKNMNSFSTVNQTDEQAEHQCTNASNLSSPQLPEVRERNGADTPGAKHAWQDGNG